MATQSLRVGIIGSGFGTYGLLPAFQRVKNCTVVAICTKNPQRITKNVRRLHVYDNWQEMLDQEKLDAVAVAVAPEAQYRILKVAINKALHVFAEKPLAITLREARELLLLAQKKGITHAVDFIFPEIPAWEKVRQLLIQRKYGELKYVRVDWNFLSYDLKNRKKTWKTDVEHGGGALSFFFSHTLYYLELFADKITNMRSLLSYAPESLNGGEVGVDLLLKFENNVNGFAHISCNTPGINRHQLLFQCDHGIIILANENSTTQNFWVQMIDEKGKGRIKVFLDKKRENEDERVATVKKIAQRFVLAALQKKQITPSFVEGVRVQELLESIRKVQL